MAPRHESVPHLRSNRQGTAFGKLVGFFCMRNEGWIPVYNVRSLSCPSILFLQVVYKGRKKKSLQYYAVKSVEKVQKPRVLREVR